MTSESEAVLAGMLKGGQLSKKDKQWVTWKMKQIQEHEMKMEIVRWMARDEEAKYYLGVALGAATGGIGMLFSQFTGQPAAEDGAAPPSAAPGPETPIGALWGWIAHPMAIHGAGAAAAGTVAGWIGGGGGAAPGMPNFADVTGLNEAIGKILMIGGGGFAGWCAMILILKAIFSGTDLGELMQGLPIPFTG